MHYIVLGGGISPEHAVSKRSAQAFQEALEGLGHAVTPLDPAEVSLEEIITQGHASDGVFPVLHGVGGEDGVIQKALEDAGIPYFGPDSEACRLTLDKTLFKKILEEHNLPTPAWNLIAADELADEPLTKAPFVLKPYDGGSSIDTFIVRSIPYDSAPLLEALDRHGRMLIEQLIEGDEVTVGILGDEALPVIEIIPPKDQEFDYENKYNGATAELCPPVHVNEALQQQAQALALAVHKATGCRHLSRTDIMINGAGELYIIDTNTLPGLTGQSLYPKAAAEAGYGWAQLVQRFASLV